MHVLVSRVVAPTRVCDARTRRQNARAARLRQQSTPARARAGTDASEPEGPAGDAAITRRDAVARSATAVAAIVAGVALANADAAFAKDLKEMEAEKAARKAALRAAAEASAKSGRGEAAFDDAAYGVSEDARTPNAHSRQEEGLKEALRNNV